MKKSLIWIILAIVVVVIAAVIYFDSKKTVTLPATEEEISDSEIADTTNTATKNSGNPVSLAPTKTIAQLVEEAQANPSATALTLEEWRKQNPRVLPIYHAKEYAKYLAIFKQINS